ncbi:MAG: hypothetical protein AAGH15_21755 [Myxococcota bacterium]
MNVLAEDLCPACEGYEAVVGTFVLEDNESDDVVVMPLCATCLARLGNFVPGSPNA